MRRRIVEARAILRIDSWSVVLVTNTERQREIRTSPPRVLRVKIVALRAEVLRIVQTRDRCEAGDILNHLRQRIAGKADELDQTARFDIGERVLLQPAYIRAEPDQ